MRALIKSQRPAFRAGQLQVACTGREGARMGDGQNRNPEPSICFGCQDDRARPIL